MSKLETVIKFFANRTEKYGAQYFTFAIFGLFNYLAALLFEYQHETLSCEVFFIKALAILLCLILAFNNKWPQRLKKFLPLYWYVTVTLTVPTLSSFLLIKNSASLLWVMNYASSILILALIFDFVMFMVALSIGGILSIGLAYASGDLPRCCLIGNIHYIFLFYNIIIVIVFSRKKNIGFVSPQSQAHVLKSNVDVVLKDNDMNFYKDDRDMKVYALDNIVKVILENMQIFADEKNIKISFYKKKHIENRTIFDKDQISKVIRNIVLNAIKRSSNDSDIRVDLLQKYATLATGITINGLCVSVQNKISKSTKVSQKNTIKSDDRKIIESHSGAIWSEVDKRSKQECIYCVLPYSNNIVSKDDKKLNRKKFTVLFVDDEESSRVAGRMILENIGYRVKVFPSGSELMDFLKYSNEKIDLIFLDMLMPDINGIDLARKIYKDRIHKHIPVIFQTGIKNEIKIEDIKDTSVVGIISKPYNKNQLEEITHKHLYQSKS